MTDKTSIDRGTLCAATALVRSALATQAYLPALTHIRFSGGWATAYDDISAIMVRSPLDLGRCLPGDLLIRALDSFSADSLMFQDGKGGAVVIVSGRSRITVPTLPDSAFPFNLPDLAVNDGEITIDQTILRGITRCLLGVGNDVTHAAAMGVTLDVDDRGCAVLFSTDNATISRFQTKSRVRLPGDSPIIMPTFFCEQLVALSKAFPDEKEEITLVILNGALVVEFGNAARIFTKTLVDLEPLDFPAILARYLKLDTIKKDLAPIPDAFDSSLGRALLVLSGEVDKATNFIIGDGVVRLRSSSAMGDAEDSLKYEGNISPQPEFFADPALIARAAKVCGLMGFMERVVVLADTEGQFVHMIAHCDNPTKQKK